MTSDTPLFDTLTRSSHPDTSREAAETLVASGRLSRYEAAAMDLVSRHPGKTGYELDQIDGNDDRRISKRLGGLANRGLLVRGEKRRCEIKGSNCVTWTAREQA